MTVVLPVMIMLVIGTGCGSSGVGKLKHVKLPQPSIVITRLNHDSLENSHVFPLPLGKTLSEHGVGILRVGFADILFSVFELRPDPGREGNLLLKFEISCDNEIFDVPLVSWNQNDEFPLLHGDTWSVKLAASRVDWEKE